MQIKLSSILVILSAVRWYKGTALLEWKYKQVCENLNIIVNILVELFTISLVAGVHYSLAIMHRNIIIIIQTEFGF